MRRRPNSASTNGGCSASNPDQLPSGTVTDRAAVLRRYRNQAPIRTAASTDQHAATSHHLAASDQHADAGQHADGNATRSVLRRRPRGLLSRFWLFDYLYRAGRKLDVQRERVVNAMLGA